MADQDAREQEWESEGPPTADPLDDVPLATRTEIGALPEAGPGDWCNPRSTCLPIAAPSGAIRPRPLDTSTRRRSRCSTPLSTTGISTRSRRT